MLKLIFIYIEIPLAQSRVVYEVGNSICDCHALLRIEIQDLVPKFNNVTEFL